MQEVSSISTLERETAAVRKVFEQRKLAYGGGALVQPRRRHVGPRGGLCDNGGAGTGVSSLPSPPPFPPTSFPPSSPSPPALVPASVQLALRQLAAVRGRQLLHVLVERHNMLQSWSELLDVALARRIELLTPLLPAATEFFLADTLHAEAPHTPHSAESPNSRPIREQPYHSGSTSEQRTSGATGALLPMQPLATCLALGPLPVTVSMPPPLPRNGQEAGAAIGLSWGVGWPANMLVDEKAMQRYARVTSLLLRLQCARHALASPEAFKELTAPRLGTSLDLSAHAVRLLRWRVHHFLSALHAHLATSIVGTLSEKLLADMLQAASLEETLALHEAFLCELEAGCFLHARAERVLDALFSMAQMALQLRALVDGRVRTSARALGQSFDACHSFLARVLHELASNDATSSQPAALLVALDFNEYYQTDLFV